MSTYQLIYKTSNKKIYALYKKHGSITKVLSTFGVKRDPRCRKLVSEKIASITGNKTHSTKFSKKASLTVELIQPLANESASLTELIKKLNLQPIGGNFTRVSNFIKENNIVFGKTASLKKHADKEVYCINSSYSRNHLSSRVRRDGWLPYKCAKCSNTGIWLNEPLKLQIDHINGVNTDHRKENLRWLCPNCHTQTPTHSGKNNRKA